ncbi:MAG: hypothetical protein ACI9S6_001395, partial [Reinekea sp.]
KMKKPRTLCRLRAFCAFKVKILILGWQFFAEFYTVWLERI